MTVKKKEDTPKLNEKKNLTAMTMLEKKKKDSSHLDILHQQPHQALHHRKAPRKVPQVNLREN